MNDAARGHDRRAAPADRAVPTWGDVGVHRLSCVLFATHLAGLALVAVAAATVGPPIAWLTGALPVLTLVLVAVVWAAHIRAPGRPREWIVTDTLAAVGAVMVASWWLGPAQYLVAGLGRPLVDVQLARLDAGLGVDVSHWAAWTARRPLVRITLALAYGTLVAQFALAQLTSGLLIRDREAVWEYAWHFSLCGIVTLAASALWPAASAFQYFGFSSTIDQTRFIRHFDALRAGRFVVIDLRDIEGLISMPSFHVAGALMVTWAVRRHRVTLAVALCVNVVLIAATVLSGAHYVVDVIAASALFAVSVWSWRVFGRTFLPPVSAPTS